MADEKDSAGINRPAKAKDRAWTWKKDDQTPGVFAGTFDHQFDRYTAAATMPTWRNRGPKGRCFGNLRYKKFAAACDFAVQPGTLNAGQPVPAGTVLKCKAVSALVASRRQGLAMVRTARRRFPDCYLAMWEHLKPTASDYWPREPGHTGHLVFPTAA